jgi:hypothetical protein
VDGWVGGQKVRGMGGCGSVCLPASLYIFMYMIDIYTHTYTHIYRFRVWQDLVAQGLIH